MINRLNAKKKKNTSLEVQTFRPPESEDYMPEPGSALESVAKQGRGETLDPRNLNDTRKHTHDGSNSQKISIANLVGFIRTVAVAPTWVPKNFADQFALYSNAGTYRLYAYDTDGQAWRLVVLT